MIQPTTMSEALQRGLLGLGDIGKAWEQTQANSADLAGKNIANKSAALTYAGELKKRQILDAMKLLPQPTSSISMGDNGKAGLGMDALGMPTGIGGPGATQAGVGGMNDARAKLLSDWYAENGRPEMADPELVKAAHTADLTKTRNASTLSNQSVTAGDVANKDAAFTLGQKQALAPFQETVASNDAVASVFKPKQAKENLNLTVSEENKNNAEAADSKLLGKNLPLDVKEQVTALSTKTGNKISIANQLDSYLHEFQTAKTSDDKVRIGRQMLKVLNSPEGADAVGVDEAKRLGDALEYHVANFGSLVGATPGKFVGRDLGGFEKQVQSTIGAVRGSIDSNRKETDRLLGRIPASAPAAAPPAPVAVDRKTMAQQAINDPEATPEEKAAAKRILGIQ